METAYFPLGWAIFLTLFAAALWGSWMQVVKHIGNYPIMGLGFFLYFFSFILVWAVTLILKPVLLEGTIWSYVSEDWNTSLTILAGGAMMAMGLYFSLKAMNRAGMLLSTALSGTLQTILGLITSIYEEGMPQSEHALLLLISCAVIMILAGFVCNYASVLRDRDYAEKQGLKAPEKKTVTFRIVMYLILAAVFTNGWSIGTATGTARNFPPIITCALMATGSFIGMTVVAFISFTVKHQWREVFCVGTSKKPIVLGLIAAACHYGGNLISIYSMPEISATLSFLFGKSSSVWSYFWGIYYKEFAGVKKRTVAVLVVGIALYFVGLALLGLFNYS
ncbi:MAG: hypothetical protein ACOX6J_04025 [Oscillospiraceae bacterium]